MNPLRRSFEKLSETTSRFLGTATAFIIALLIVSIWGLSGHFLHYSETWQLLINTFTTIVTFLMVFLIQHTQNRDSKYIREKLDLIMRSNMIPEQKKPKIKTTISTMDNLYTMEDITLYEAMIEVVGTEVTKQILRTARSMQTREL